MKFSKAKALNSLVVLFKKYENFTLHIHCTQNKKQKKSELQQLKLFAPKMQFFNAFYFGAEIKLFACDNSQRFFTNTQITIRENQPGGFTCVCHLIALSLSHLP
jgi:hypothetical protein